MAVLYCGVVGVLRTLSEGHAIYQLFTHPDMTAAEAFSSAICSHLMTPAINAALAVLQVLSCSLSMQHQHACNVDFGGCYIAVTFTCIIAIIRRMAFWKHVMHLSKPSARTCRHMADKGACHGRWA